MTDCHTRPQLHLTADEGWINDPLGLTYHDGRYHLFYQYVPGQTVWGLNCHWGHATSEDLLTWTSLPVALAPGDGDDGCWSGSIVAPDGETATLFYTTVSREDVQIGQVRVARPNDDQWLAWTKQGDAFAKLPDGVAAIAYRDPYVFHDGQRWQLLMGAGLADGTATALVHSSEDLREWRYDGELASRHTSERDPLWTGSVWECPQLFPMGDQWVLTVSVWEPGVPHYEAYAIGSYSEGRFTAEHWSRLTYGPSYYAGSTFTDAEGRRGMVYWLRGVDDVDGQWASATSVPHLLSLRGQHLLAEPHPNLEIRRGPRVTLSPGTPALMSTVVDLEWDATASQAPAALRIDSQDGDPVLTLDIDDGQLRAETTDGSWSMPVVTAPVRVLIDGSVCEIFTTTGTMALPISPASALVLTASAAADAVAYNLALTPTPVHATSEMSSTA